VGKTSSKRRGVIMLLELRWNVFSEEMDPTLTEDEKLKIKEIQQYWKGKSAYEMWSAHVPKEILEIINKHQIPLTTSAATPDTKST
jgi:isocitrate dehydrogenase